MTERHRRFPRRKKRCAQREGAAGARATRLSWEERARFGGLSLFYTLDAVAPAVRYDIAGDTIRPLSAGAQAPEPLSSRISCARARRAQSLDALELTILAAEAGDERWPKMAARWHSRFVDETPEMGASESALVLAAVCALGGPSLLACGP